MARIVSLILSVALLSLAVAVPTTQMGSAERQVGFTFDTSAADPTPAAATPAAETETTTAEEPPAETPTVEIDPTTTTETSADTEEAPEATPDGEADPTMATETSDMGTAMTTTTTTTVTDPVSMTGPFAFAYNIGGLASGDFAADPQDYVIGDTLSFDLPGSNIIANTTTEPYKAIYESHRHGRDGATWGYDLPVATAGTYECTLHYAETYDAFFTEDSNREFKVMIAGDGDGTTVQDATFDVMVELGGQEFTPYTRTFTNLMVDTKIMIREEPVSGTGDAFLSGVSCAMIA